MGHGRVVRQVLHRPAGVDHHVGAEAGREAKLAARDGFAAPDLAMLSWLDDAAFRALFTASPVKRIGRDRFVRNVMIALGNAGDRALAAPAMARLGDGSALVRAMAIWALSRLAPDLLRQEAATRRPAETDAGVLDEWQMALAEDAA